MARTLKRKRTRRHKRKRNNNAITVKKGGGFFDFFYKTRDQPMFNKKNFTDPRSDEQIEEGFKDDANNRNSMFTNITGNELIENFGDLYNDKKKFKKEYYDNKQMIDEDNEEGFIKKYPGHAVQETVENMDNPKNAIISQEFTGERVDTTKSQKSKNISVFDMTVGVILFGGVGVGIGFLIQYSMHVHSS